MGGDFDDAGKYGGRSLDVGIPQEVEPLVVALTLAIVTDYAVFYLSAGPARPALCRGRQPAGALALG